MNAKRKIRLVYFGRLTESKHIEIVIRTLAILLKNQYSASLDLIGGCSEKYMGVLQEIITDLGMADGLITFHGQKPMSIIARILSAAHYFVFPSEEPKEGHSNALTEAMAFGVVPIVSNAGFNATICGNIELVVYDYNSESYAQKIMNIEISGKWDEYSRFAYQRIADNYTEKNASNALKEAAHYMGLI